MRSPPRPTRRPRCRARAGPGSVTTSPSWPGTVRLPDASRRADDRRDRRRDAGCLHPADGRRSRRWSARIIPLPTAANPGRGCGFGILDGAGSPEAVPGDHRAAGRPPGAQVVAIGNADRFTYAATDVRYDSLIPRDAGRTDAGRAGYRRGHVDIVRHRRLRCHDRRGVAIWSERVTSKEQRQLTEREADVVRSLAARAAAEKQATDPVILEVGDVLAICDLLRHRQRAQHPAGPDDHRRDRAGDRRGRAARSRCGSRVATTCAGC